MNKSCSALITLILCVLCFSVIAHSVELPSTLSSGNDMKVEQDVLDDSNVTYGGSSNVVVRKKVEEEYRLGAGDKIKIHVFRESDMDVEVRLGASGDIRYPFLGKIHVIGMTLPDLERKITDDLSSGYLVDPQVRVSMEEFRPFYINGEVKAPGAYPYQPGLTVRKSISLAGGFTDDTDQYEISLIQAMDIEKKDLKVLLSQRVDPGDILTIKKIFYYVNGEVNKPGKYSYQSGLTVRKAISLAGGFSVEADKRKIFLINGADFENTEKKVQLSQRMSPDDVLTIKKSFFFVNGEVSKPGKYSYQTEMTYRMAIAMAGGLKNKSNDDKVYVVHEGKGQETFHVNDLDAEIQPGDVIIAKEGFF